MKDRNVHTLFLTLIFSNAIIGLGDLFVGTYFVFQTPIKAFVFNLSPGLLSTFLQYVYTFLETLSLGSVGLAIFYALSHGLIKLSLAWALYRGKLWSYPAAIIFFALFSLYQIIRLAHRFTIFETILLFLNAAVLVMVLIEYRRVRAGKL